MNPRSYNFKSREITANFRYFDVDNKGVFYTDVNGYKIVKRDINKLYENKPWH
jgi:hypothetical protein